MCGVVFSDGVARRGWGRVRNGVARLGRVDKELIGIFTLCFVFGVVWRRFFSMGWGVACPQRGGRGWVARIKS